MPPFRPFPFPSLSIGTDITHVPRIARLVASQRTFPRFLRKVLTVREEQQFHLRFAKEEQRYTGRDSAFGDGERDGWWVQQAARFLAGRWAAKEAVVKACSWRSLTFDEIQILKEDGSKRVYGVILDKPGARQAMRELEMKQDSQFDGLPSQQHALEEVDSAGQIVEISISHDGEYATAVCMAARET